MTNEKKRTLTLCIVVGGVLLIFLFGRSFWVSRISCTSSDERLVAPGRNVSQEHENIESMQMPHESQSVEPPLARATAPASTTPVSAKLNSEDLPLPAPPSTIVDLMNKGLPVISNPRKAAYTQTAEQSIPEVIADLGNQMTIAYCSQWIEIKTPPDLIQCYYRNIMPNIKVLRLVKEGRKNPAMVSSLLNDAIRKCLADHENVQQACLQSLRKRERSPGTGDDDIYYNQYRKYEHPRLELLRLHHVIYSSFYILANINQLEPDLLTEWVLTERDKRYHCGDMDVWLVDCYFRQRGKGSEAATRHADLTQGSEISGRKVQQSRWDAIWDIHHPLLSAKKVYLDDIETIEVLAIPPKLPDGVDEKAKDKILQNFLKYAKESFQ